MNQQFVGSSERMGMLLARFYEITDAGPYAMASLRMADVSCAVRAFLRSMHATQAAHSFVLQNETLFFEYKQQGMHIIELAELAVAVTQPIQ